MLRLFFCFTAIALAQRADYDASRQVAFKGSVTRIDWAYPHTFFFVDVRDPNGTVRNWAVETGNLIDLEKSGWKAESLHIGDVVRVEGLPLRTPKRQVFAKSVIADRTGQKLFTLVHKPEALKPGPAPRWPDGQVRLGGAKGYWAASKANLIDSTAGKIAMSEEGLLTNLSDADRVAPLQPWAKTVYEYRQRNLLKDDPLPRCLPPGGPRQFQIAPGFQFVEQRELKRILVLLGGGDRNWRVIFTDGRPSGQTDETVRGYYGTSVGRWEKDTLVVETVGFNERFWMANGGLPHTEALHLTERFTRSDLNTLKYEVTVDDPRTYTRPWTAAWTMQWDAGEEMQEYFCEDNAETTFVR